MKRFIFFLQIIICISIVLGCSNKDVSKLTSVDIEKTESVNAKLDSKEKELKENLKRIDEIEKSFSPLTESVNQNDKKTFMTYQNKENPLFYKEQQRWFEEVIYKKEKGYEYNIELSNVILESDSNGEIDFAVIVSPANSSERFVHSITYTIIKDQETWKLNDIAFEELTEGIFTIHYLEGQDDAAMQVLEDSKDIVNLYSSQFEWAPETINVKLYDTMEQLNATIPWTQAGGWNEKGESYKLIAYNSEEARFSLLAHELTHTLLSDLTNDNASLYLQEGLATTLQMIVSRNDAGIVDMNFDQASEQLQVLKESLDRPLLTLEELSALDYDNGDPFYQDGALLTNYLIQSAGVEKYKEFLTELKNYPYIDKRQEHKLEISNRHTLEVLEKMFAPSKELSNNYLNYY